MLSEAQKLLLQALIEADRAFRTAEKKGELQDWSFRGVEIGMITGFRSRTAESLAEAGLCEVLDMGNGLTYAFLGKYQPYD
jgi:hypothetical protein